MTAEASTLRCPSCGAAVDPKSAECRYCRVALHSTRCPWCFAWTFAESRDCERCGSRGEPAGGPAVFCPSCRKALAARALGKARLAGCAECGGVWADAESFKTICADRETQSAYLGEGSLLPAPAVSDPQASPIVYRPCPVCAELMNRFNFANCSGVVLDSCRPHGVWFDADELRRIVEFIRGGGLDLARERERRALELERRRRDGGGDEELPREVSVDPTSPPAIATARALLSFLLADR